jgi:NAD(P)-dependent dehydrogenase (short-subunit alcohol dehydrogenase family)
MLLTNKVAIITGGNRGIGAATAKLFAKKGASVVVTFSSEKSKGQANETIQGLEGLAVKCDVTQKIDVKNLMARHLSSTVAGSCIKSQAPVYKIFPVNMSAA